MDITACEARQQESSAVTEQKKWELVQVEHAPSHPLARSCLVMALSRDGRMGAGSVAQQQDGGIRSLPDVLLSSRLKVCFSPERGGNVHVFSLNQKGTMLSFGGPGWGLPGESVWRQQGCPAEPSVSDAHAPGWLCPRVFGT